MTGHRRALMLAAAAWLILAPTAAPAEPPGLPKISGDYLRARPRLLALGYRPMRRTEDVAPEDLCNDWGRRTTCNRHTLPEGWCAVDIDACRFFWKSPTGPVVGIDTLGSGRAGRIAAVYWADRADINGMVKDPAP